MSDAPTIRLATPADVAALLDLMQGFYAEAGFGLDREANGAALRALIAEPALGAIWIAHASGVAAGHAVLERSIGKGVLALCAEAVGAMDAARDATLEYLQTRKQFGVPIGRFQALQHRMADVLLEVEQARSAVINAAAALGSDRIARERALSAAKVSIGRIGTLVAQEAIQLHGGIGMTWELALAHHAKRLILIDHQLGDEDHHLARFIELGRAA